MTAPFLYSPTFAPVFNGQSVPNGLLYTYEAGTTNPKPTFADPSGIVPNSNPVQLDVTGAATVRLEPGAYHFVLTDSTGTTVYWDQDFYRAPYLTGDDIISLLSGDQLGSLTHPVVAEETTLGITPVNKAYPVGYPERYAANTNPGVTDMSLAFQNAINVLMLRGGELVYGKGPYLLNSVIDCGTNAAGGVPPITVRCTATGHNSGIGVLPNHSGVAVFDATGNDTIQFMDVCIRTPVPATTFPSTGILLARNSTKSSLINRIVRPRIVGYFGVACIYNYGSENSVIDSPYCANYNTAAGTSVITYTANNINALTSIVPGRIASGTVSCIVHDLIAPALLNRAGTTTSDCVRLEQSDNFHCFGGWMSCASGTVKGRSLIYIDQTNAPSSMGVVIGLVAENNTQPVDYGVLFSTSASTQTPTGWAIENCRMITTTRAFAAIDNKTTFDGLRISHISELTSKGLSIPGTLQGSSVLQTGPMLLTIGTVSATCFIQGSSSAWTITNMNGIGFDTGTAVTSGFGTPTGNSIVNNFPGATATLLQTSQTVAEILVILKSRGWIVA